MLYDVGDINFYNECSIYNLDEEIVAYFPVITNKEITNIECGAIAAVLNGKNIFDFENMVVIRLEKKEQDSLNFKYRNYYISFVKFRVKFNDWNEIRLCDSINLCDTKVWVYNKEEYIAIDYDYNYMTLNIVKNEEEAKMPNWKIKIEEMFAKIKLSLSGESDLIY